MNKKDLPVVAEELPRSGNRLSKWIGARLLAIGGWQIKGKLPASPRFIIVVAPHTSNWDFFVGISVVMALGLKVRFLAKHSLFFWPVGWLLKRLGGIPVDRSSAHGVVGQLTALFHQCEQLVVAVAPEGTRKKVTRWKSGAIHLSHQAQVPLLLVYFDYQQKVVGFGPCRIMSANTVEEMTRMQGFYADVVAKNPANV